MGTTTTYISRFRRNFPGYFPNFPARDNISVGDFGIVTKGQFSKMGNLKTDYGIEFEIEERPLSGREVMQTNCDVSYTTGVDTKVDGIALPSVKLNLRKANSVFFSTVISSMVEMANAFGSIYPQILELYKAGKWEKKYVIISAIEKTNNTVIVVTEETGSEVILSSDMNIPAEKLLSVDAKINFSVAKNTNGAYIFTQGEGSNITHRFKLIKIKGLFKKKVQPLMGTQDQEETEMVEELR